MKKTLITLAALAMASVAQAADAVLVDTDPAAAATYTGTVFSTNKAFTLTMVLDWDAALDSTHDWQNKLTFVQASSNDNGWWSQALYLFNGGTGSTTLSAGFRVDKDGWMDLNTDSYPNTYHITTTGGMTHGAGNATLDNATYCVDGTLNLAYSYDGNKTFTLSVLKADGTLATMSATYDDLWTPGDEYGRLALGGSVTEGVITSVSAYQSVLGSEEILSVLTPVTPDAPQVPEPTTATLSLLALAGLCARRRRK